MRLIFSVLGLLVVLAAVGLMVRKQLDAVNVRTPADAASSSAGTPAQQSKALQRKVQEDVNRLMQQAPTRGEPGQ